MYYLHSHRMHKNIISALKKYIKYQYIDLLIYYCDNDDIFSSQYHPRNLLSL